MRLIDADELKIDYGFTWDDITPTHEELYELIDRQPTIEPKKGEWIDQDQGAFYTTECSECHKEPLLDAYGDYVISDFCPNCGADMRGETE